MRTPTVVTPSRPINLDRITIRRERTLAAPQPVWVIYSPEHFPRAQVVLVDGCPMYWGWSHEWNLSLWRIDRYIQRRKQTRK